MTQNKYKENKAMPIENHATAAWANIEKTKPVSKVAIPNVLEVMNAKDYVDGNQK